MININNKFWESLDQLVRESDIVIDRPKGTRHPRYPDLEYPVDYGYIKNTKSPDNSEIDIYTGKSQNKFVTGIACIIDMNKRDSEIKVLFSCTDEEMEIIYKLCNEKMMSGVLIRREFVI
jgi:inorganic pyrophosphatase